MASMASMVAEEWAESRKERKEDRKIEKMTESEGEKDVQRKKRERKKEMKTETCFCAIACQHSRGPPGTQAGEGNRGEVEQRRKEPEDGPADNGLFHF